MAVLSATALIYAHGVDRAVWTAPDRISGTGNAPNLVPHGAIHPMGVDQGRRGQSLGHPSADDPSGSIRRSAHNTQF
jgi:hypothetical protein